MQDFYGLHFEEISIIFSKSWLCNYPPTISRFLRFASGTPNGCRFCLAPEITPSSISRVMYSPFHVPPSTSPTSPLPLQCRVVVVLSHFCGSLFLLLIYCESACERSKFSTISLSLKPLLVFFRQNFQISSCVIRGTVSTVRSSRNFISRIFYAQGGSHCDIFKKHQIKHID